MTAPRPGPSVPTRTRVAAAAGGAVAALSRRLGRGGGSVIGGRAILAIDPQALRRLSAGREVLRGERHERQDHHDQPARRRPGDRRARSSPTCSAPTCRPGSPPRWPPAPAPAAAVLEVDEAWLGRVVDATAPPSVVLLNLSRDQLDRNNEVRRLASAWRDHPGRAARRARGGQRRRPLSSGRHWPAARVSWVGAGQPGRPTPPAARSCGGRVHSRPTVGLAAGAAPAPARRSTCGSRTAPSWPASGERRPSASACRAGPTGPTPPWPWPRPAALGVDPGPAAGGHGGHRPRSPAATAVDRRRRPRPGCCWPRTRPAGWRCSTCWPRPPPPVVVAINARIADGQDPSWLWDVPFERLQGRLVVATGERSRDLAVRLHYAGVEHRHQPDLMPLAERTAAGRRRPRGRRRRPTTRRSSSSRGLVDHAA